MFNMPTPKENAIKFVGIWNLERPASVHTITQGENELIRMVLKEEGILFPPDAQGRVSKLYGGSAEDFRRRGTSESLRVLNRKKENSNRSLLI